MPQVLVMLRKEGFYTIDAIEGVPLEKQAEDNAVLNPGTLRVEDWQGNVLWRQQ